MKNILTFCLTLLVLVLQGQTQISGKIIDKNGEPVFGVNVSTDRLEGSVSDFDGLYTLVVKEGSFVLKLSAIGYKTQELNITIAKGEKKELNFSLEDQNVAVDDVIVYGSKRGKRIQEEIQSVEVISTELLENNNVTDGIQAVNLLSGVSVLDGQISVRGGSGYAFGVGSRVILVQDGVPNLTPERDEINWDFISTENIEQIELLKGGGGVQYGSSALNGVLSVRSAWVKEVGKPESEITLYSDVVGNPKTKEAKWWRRAPTYFDKPHTAGVTFAHRRKSKKNLEFVSSGTFHSFQSHLRDEYNERFRVGFNFRHRPNKISGLTYGFYSKYMYRNDSFFFLYEDNKEGKYTPLAVFAKFYHYAQFQPFIKYYDDKGNGFKYNGSLYHDYRAVKNANDRSYRAFSDFQYTRKTSFGLDILAGLTLDNKYIFAPALRATLYPDDHLSSFNFQDYAIYLTLDYKYKNFNFSAGGRYEIKGFESILNSSKPVFFGGLNYKITENDFFRVSLSQSFRVPNVAEKFINESLGPINIFANTEIKPETAYNAEIGYRKTLNFGDKFRGFADFAFFWTEFDNFVEFNFDNHAEHEDSTAKLGFQAQNVAKARVFGWELNLEESYRHKDFEITGKFGYTYAYGVDLNANPNNKNIFNFIGNAFSGISISPEQQERFVLSPNGFQAKNPLYGILKYRFRHTLKLDLNLKYKRVGIGANLAYYSYLDHIDQVFVLFIEGLKEDREALNYGGTSVLNLRAFYQVNDKFNFSFIIKNLSNTDFSLRPAKPNAPRSFTLQAKFMF